jgi:predicted dehydrogenase
MQDAKMVGNSLRWGLMATGGIAKKFALDVKTHGIVVVAVASRDLNRAKAFATELGIGKAYGSYEELLADPDVNAIYIAIPNHLHAEWSLKAALAGKHILCEKPAAMDEAECQAVIQTVKQSGVFFMEGFMYRLHPQWGLVKALIAEGCIGEVKSMHSSFCFDMGEKPDNIRQIRKNGGGALMDVGCYCLSFSRMIAEEEPKVTQAFAQIGSHSGVDAETSAKLEFPSGRVATFKCAIRWAEPNIAIIYGARGVLEISQPWHPSKDRAEIRLTVAGAPTEVYRVGDGLGQFTREALEMAEHLGQRQSPTLTWEDSLGQARALESLRRSAGLL